MREIYQIIHEWAAEPFAWGERDCALLLADWYKHVHGEDPAAHLRGQYFDAASCQRLTGWFRDPVAVIESCLSTVGGLPRTSEYKEGDVGVINAFSQGKVIRVSAVWLGRCWAARTDDNESPIVTVNNQMAAPVAAWGMGYNAP